MVDPTSTDEIQQPLSAVRTTDKEAQKEIVKEALKEWLDEQWAAFGKWTARGLAAVAFSALAYWWLTTYGWHR